MTIPVEHAAGTLDGRQAAVHGRIAASWFSLCDGPGTWGRVAAVHAYANAVVAAFFGRRALGQYPEIEEP